MLFMNSEKDPSYQRIRICQYPYFIFQWQIRTLIEECQVALVGIHEKDEKEKLELLLRVLFFVTIIKD